MTTSPTIKNKVKMNSKQSFLPISQGFWVSVDLTLSYLPSQHRILMTSQNVNKLWQPKLLFTIQILFHPNLYSQAVITLNYQQMIDNEGNNLTINYEQYNIISPRHAVPDRNKSAVESWTPLANIFFLKKWEYMIHWKMYTLATGHIFHISQNNIRRTSLTWSNNHHKTNHQL